MRKTITLDRDVDALIRTVMKERGITFQEAVNSAIRAGIARRGPFVQKSFSLGAAQDVRWDKALETAAGLEDEELRRKITQR